MFRSTIAILLALSLAACGGASEGAAPSGEAPAPCADAAPHMPVDARVEPDATPAADAGTDAKACGFVNPHPGYPSSTVEAHALDPAAIDLGDDPEVVTYVVLRGCGFLDVQDVEVNVISQGFRIVSDDTIVVAVKGFTRADFELPTRVQVDVIVRPANQAQLFLDLR